MPYTKVVEGVVGLNYGLAPLPADAADVPAVVRSAAASARTPVIETDLGDPVRIHVLVPWSEQGHVFSIEGHRWPLEPGRAGTQLLSSQQIGGLEATTLVLEGGAGGIDGLAGDYIYGDRRAPYRQAGLWGILRVRPLCDAEPPVLRPLAPDRPSCPVGTDDRLLVAAGAAALIVLGVSAMFARRRARRRAGA